MKPGKGAAGGGTGGTGGRGSRGAESSGARLVAAETNGSMQPRQRLFRRACCELRPRRLSSLVPRPSTGRNGGWTTLNCGRPLERARTGAQRPALEVEKRSWQPRCERQFPVSLRARVVRPGTERDHIAQLEPRRPYIHASSLDSPPEPSSPTLFGRRDAVLPARQLLSLLGMTSLAGSSRVRPPAGRHGTPTTLTCLQRRPASPRDRLPLATPRPAVIEPSDTRPQTW